MAGFGGLMALVVVVVAFASLRPPGKTAVSAGERPATASVSVSEPTPASTRTPEATRRPAAQAKAEATPAPEPAPAAAPAATRPKPKPKPAPVPKTLPEKMASLPSGTKQVVIITGERIGSKSGKLMLYEKDGARWTEVMNVTANFGDNGLVDGAKRKQGNLQTPTGIWTIGSFLFGLHSSPPAGTKMPYRAIKESSYWSSERDSTYNTWVDHRVSGEHLIDADPQYEYAFNTGYNAPPNKRVIGRGTAIFIHCFEPPGNRLGKYTHGCIAISRENMIALFKRLDPDRKPVCAIGTLQEGSPTSIWAY